jgi:hypothetical protein
LRQLGCLYTGPLSPDFSLSKVKVKVKVTLRPTISRSVSPGFESHAHAILAATPLSPPLPFPCLPSLTKFFSAQDLTISKWKKHKTSPKCNLSKPGVMVPALRTDYASDGQLACISNSRHMKSDFTLLFYQTVPLRCPCRNVMKAVYRFLD